MSTIPNKEALRKAIQDDIAKKIAEIILPEFPDATHIYFNPNVEYHDEDFEYFASTLSIDGAEGTIINLHETGWTDDEGDYEKIEELANKLFRIIDGRDFAFVYGTEGGDINMKAYK